MSDASPTSKIEALAAAQEQEEAAAAGGAKRPAKKPDQKQQLLALLDDWQLFHTSDGRSFATGVDDGIRATYLIGGRDLEMLIRKRAYLKSKNVPEKVALKDALDTLAARALFEGPQEPVFIRVGQAGGGMVLDLHDALGQAVVVPPGGAPYLTCDPPVRFLRMAGMLPIPAPQFGHSVELLRKHTNLGDHVAFVLAVGWLIAALKPRGPYPILGMTAEQGSGKSWTQRILRACIDPHMAPFARFKDEEGLIIKASRARVLAIDNLSYLKQDRSDLLCQLTHGIALSKRKLHTDVDEVLIEVCVPMMINGIVDPAVRPDLNDRMFSCQLSRIANGAYQQEAELEQEFEADRPKILGALLTAVSSALEHVAHVELEPGMRMADAVAWITAAERSASIPWEPGEFQRVYLASREASQQQVLDGYIFVPHLTEVAKEHGSWKGRASELYDELCEEAGLEVTRKKLWPGAAHVMSGHLRRLAPLLRNRGIDIEFDGSDGTERKLITINYTPSCASSDLNPEPPPAAVADIDHDGGEPAASAGPEHGCPIPRLTKAYFDADEYDPDEDLVG